jgi:hypothetical protein
MTGTYLLLRGLLPIEEPNRVRVLHAERDEFDVRLRECLFLQTIHCTLSVLLR